MSTQGMASRHSRIGRVWVATALLALTAFILLLGLPAAARAALDAPQATTQVHQRSTTGPVIPSWMKKASGGMPSDYTATSGAVLISGVPGYSWRHGCGPTAVGMVVGYYDTHGYPDLIYGEASAQTSYVSQAIASQGSSTNRKHYEDYSLPMDDTASSPRADRSESPAGDEHRSDSIADFMHTSWSVEDLQYGWSWSDMLAPAFSGYVSLKSPGYAPTATEYNPYTRSLTWSVVKTEIGAGRPMVFLVDSSGDGLTDHFVTVIGYRETNGYPEYACWDTWSTTSIRWEQFRSMSREWDWGVWGGTAFRLGGGDPPPPGSDPAITVTSPNGGEVWSIGQSKTITWTSSRVTGNVKIEISRDGGATWSTVLASTANDGSQLWAVTSPATAQARVRVSSTTSAAVVDVSDGDFAIQGPTITVTSPNGGEVWWAGKTQSITWTSSGASGYVKIEISRDGGGMWATIVSSTANDGQYSWVARTPATSQARMRVSSTTNAAVSDVSDGDFVIEGPTITVTSPNGGEVWALGQAQTITWTSTGTISSVKILLSRNGGLTWSTLSSSTANDGSFTWIASGAATVQARIRVGSASFSTSTVLDASDADFTIGAPVL